MASPDVAETSAPTAASMMSERRSHPRVGVPKVRSSRGRIVDFSPCGMRIRRILPWARGRDKSVTLKAPGFKMRLRASAVWCRKDGSGYMVGLSFDQLTDEQSHRLRQLVVAYGVRRPLGASDGQGVTAPARAA